MNRLLLAICQLILFFGWAQADDVGIKDIDTINVAAWEKNYGKYPFRSYKTCNLTSPVVKRMVESEACYDGRHTFVALRGGSVDNAEPMILDDKGHLVWAQNVHGLQPYNLMMQEYKGEPHLTMWLGNDAVGGHGEGYYYILNSSYQEVAKLTPHNGLRADLHELVITPEGTAIISIYQNMPIVYGGKKLYVWDCLFQEIDIATNELLFEWRATEHHTLAETYSKIGSGGRNSHSPWDWYHINSVQKDKLGNYFVSARYTHTLTYINGKTGDIIWILGGRRNMFQDLSDGAATDFASQHFARMHELTDFPDLMAKETKAINEAEDKDSTTEKLVSIFDNGADDRIRVREYSRGLLLKVTYSSELSSDNLPATGETKDGHTVELVQAYTNPGQISSGSQGSVQVIPATKPGTDPTIGVGYGQKAVLTEFSADGSVVCDTRFAPAVTVKDGSVQSYRYLKYPWVGKPLGPPTVVFDDLDDAVYVSWNGATEVRSWKLQHTQESRSRLHWSDLMIVEKEDFETRINYTSEARRYLRVVALGEYGKELGVSLALDTGKLEEYKEAQFNASMALWSQIEDELMGSQTLPLKLAMFIVCGIAFSLTVYGCYREYFNWRRNKTIQYDRLDDDMVGKESSMA